jgi:hypothetical protein
MKFSTSDPPWQIVVVGLAAAAAEGVPAALAGRLAAATELPLREIDSRQIPQESLAYLAENGNGWWAAVPIDAGVPLPAGGSWAEALGAWRQPTLLVLSGDQIETGLPAAATALMRQWGVPLLGLLQAGGRWGAEERRRDGLPWLGSLPPRGEGAQAADGVETGEGLQEVLAVLLLRWRQLQESPPAS